MPGSFLDTNVLAYMAKDKPLKAERDEALLAQSSTVSGLVQNELATVLRRKASLSWAEVDAFLATIRSLAAVAPLTLQTHELGLTLAARYGVSVYDALIIAAALLAECEVVWSEDMQHGLRVEERLRIANPFAA